MIAAFLASWVVIAFAVGLLIGRAMRIADERDRDPLADQPAEVLTPTEVDRRIERLERSWLL